MFDVVTFSASMKIMWSRRIGGESSYSKLVLTIYFELITLKKYGGKYVNILMLRIKIPFWKDVLKHY